MNKKTKLLYPNLRYLGNRRIGGIIIAFTDSSLKDAYDNYWTKDTDFALQRYDRRPLYAEHRGDMEEAGLILNDDVRITDKGLYMECDVLANPVGDHVLRMVIDGKGFYSTGVMPGSWVEAVDGWVELWPFVEASVTQRPATRQGLTRADLVRSFIGDDSDETEDKFLRKGPVFNLNDVYVFNQDEGAGASSSGNGSVAAPATAAPLTAEQLAQVTSVVREVVQQDVPARSLTPAPLPELLRPPSPAAGALNLEVHHRYDHMSLLGLATWGNLRWQANRLRGAQRTELIRALQAKMEKQVRRDDSLTEVQLVSGHRRMIDFKVVEDWGPHLRADEAMKADYANYGDELVPTLLNSVLWYFFMMETRVLANLNSFQMPSDPYDYPIVTSGATIRGVPELADQANMGVHNSVIPTSKIGTDKVTFAAGKVGALVLASYELFEDSAVSIAEMWARQLMRDIASAIDYILVNGDESDTTVNISHYGAAPSTDASGVYDKILEVDGLRHMAVGASQTVAQTSITADSNVALRKVMGARGKFGLDKRKLLNFVDPDVYYEMLELDAIESISDIGSAATLLTGEVDALKGVPVIPIDELEATNASGQIEDSHDSTLGSHLVVNKEMVLVGVRRGISTELFKVPGGEGYAIDVTARLDIQEMEAGAVAYGYNIGGS